MLTRYKPAAQDILNKPFALFMGPQRAGTSWIDRYLRRRGDVALPGPVKEIFFFDRHYGRGLDFYFNHFDLEGPQALAAEVTTTAFDHPDAPRRVFETFGNDVTLVCPLRHPVSRSWSLYRHCRRYGLVSGSLQEACARMPRILDSSRYAAHLCRWQGFFPPEKIHILFQEDLEENQSGYIGGLCDILGVPRMEIDKALTGRFNAGTTPPLAALAGAAQKGADWLRSRRMYFAVNFAKRIGAKDMIFGRDNPHADAAEIPAQERAWLENRLEPEIAALEALAGAVPQWRARA